MPRPTTTLEADPVLVRLIDPRRTGTRPSPLPHRTLGSIRRTLLLKRGFDYAFAGTLLLIASIGAIAIAPRREQGAL